MKVSFEGIGECVASFYNDSGARAESGAPVKLSGNGKVAACGDGELLFGVAVSAGEEFAAVQVQGFVILPYSGTAPSVGYAKLSADGKGGVKKDDNGKSYAIVQVDTTTKTIGLML